MLRGFARPAVELLHRSLSEPELVQTERLSAILGNLKGTAFAQDHGIRGDESLAEFRKRVPLRSYDELRPWFDRVVAAEPRVLTRSTVRSLLKTSGTTSAAKLLPVTDSYARAVAAGQALWRLALVRDHEAVTRGSALTVVSPAVEGRTTSGLPFGSNTGRMHQGQPWIVRIRYPVPYPVYGIQDPEARVYTLLRFALQARLSTITTANPSTILLLARKLVEYREALAADLEAGSLDRGPAARLPRPLRRRLGWWLRRRQSPRDWRPARIWDLVTVNCWKGGPAGFFLKQLPEALGADVAVREVGITASEGYFAIPVDDAGAGGLTWLGGHLLEFIDGSGEARWAWELEEGARYRLVVTTSAGLYRYDLDDIVEVVGYHGRLPVLRFVRKGSNVLNITGEKVTEDQVVLAMTTALNGGALRAFTVGHRLAEVPVLRLALEGLTEGDGPSLAHSFDVALRAGNVEYESKRSSGRLGPPEAVVVPEGTYARYRLQRVQEGAPEGQVKDPLVALDEVAWERLRRAAESLGEVGW